MTMSPCERNNQPGRILSIRCMRSGIRAEPLYPTLTFPTSTYNKHRFIRYKAIRDIQEAPAVHPCTILHVRIRPIPLYSTCTLTYEVDCIVSRRCL